MTTWRQGYCPPFGEDITYWALAEIVKGHAGIRDTDHAATVEAKLEAVLPAGPDREWFRQRLRALLGLAAPDASREENFAAWLRFFEDVAASRPTVLVFEDLHWADEALLAFLEYLTTHVGLRALCWSSGRRGPSSSSGTRASPRAAASTASHLEPLSPAETARLVAGLLGEPDDRDGGRRTGGRALRRQPLLRRAVRATAERHRAGRAAARLRAGGHRRPPGRPARRPEGAPRRRRRGRQRLLGRGPGGDGRA